MIATLTSKGQITIPLAIRKRLRLKAGDRLDFDEQALYLKASKVIPEEAWEAFGKDWRDPWPTHTAQEALEALRGKVELPAARQPTL